MNNPSPHSNRTKKRMLRENLNVVPTTPNLNKRHHRRHNRRLAIQQQQKLNHENRVHYSYYYNEPGGNKMW